MSVNFITSRPNLLDLPAEIYALIENQLDRSDFANLTLTCRRFRQQFEPYLWRKVDLSLPSAWQYGAISSIQLDEVEKCKSSLGAGIAGHDVPRLVAREYREAKLRSRLKQVRQALSMEYRSGAVRELVLELLEDEDYSAVLSGVFTRLESLSVKPCRVQNKWQPGKASFAHIDYPGQLGLGRLLASISFRSLDILITENWFTAIDLALQAAPNLEKLVLHSRRYKPDPTIDLHTLLEPLPQLHHFELDSLFDDMVPALKVLLSRFPNLSTLHLTSIYNDDAFDEDLATYIRNLPLRTLKLHSDSETGHELIRALVYGGGFEQVTEFIWSKEIQSWMLGELEVSCTCSGSGMCLIALSQSASIPPLPSL